jgi:hypothetical protein
LQEIVSSYLFKDLLELDGIKRSDKIERLLQAIAFQIGSEVSLTEIGTNLGMSKNTVEKYLDLLEKTFVLFRINGFSRNLRKEIFKYPKYYFWDVGIRNALINNFNHLNIRNDVGMLWENYIVVEMLKRQEYLGAHSNNYFWRTYDKKEIDFIEERNGILSGYEIKWQQKIVKPPLDWTKAYPNAQFHVINNENYNEYITKIGS